MAHQVEELTDVIAVRGFLDGCHAALERAAANGTLARTKLDLVRAFRGAHANLSEDRRAAMVRLLEVELEALCADLRLGTLVVTSHVERGPDGPRGSVKAVGIVAIVAILVAALAGFFALITAV